MSKHEVSHAKQHESALENPQTRALLDQLIVDWPTLNLVQRGDRLNVLLTGGCTQRGLAKNLVCDEGSIRRNCRIAALSFKDRTAVEKGANPDRFLRRQHSWAEQVDDVCRLLRETLDGGVSTDLANNIVWFLCFYDPDVCLHDVMRDKCLEYVNFKVWAEAGWIRSSWLPVRSHLREVNQQNRSLMRLAQDCQRQPESPKDDSIDRAHLIEALIRFIRKIENRTSLIEWALDKARLVVRSLDRSNRADFELVEHARTLSPEDFAVALREHMRIKNSIPKSSRRLVA